MQSSSSQCTRPAPFRHATIHAADVWRMAACAASAAQCRFPAISFNQGQLRPSREAAMTLAAHASTVDAECAGLGLFGAAGALQHPRTDRRSDCSRAGLPDQHVPHPAPAQRPRMLSRALGAKPVRAAGRYLPCAAGRAIAVSRRQRPAVVDPLPDRASSRLRRWSASRPQWSDQKLAATLDITNARIRALLFRLTEEVRYPGFAADAMFAHLGGELAIELARFYAGARRTARHWRPGRLAAAPDRRAAERRCQRAFAGRAGRRCATCRSASLRAASRSAGAARSATMSRQAAWSGPSGCWSMAKASRPSPSPWASASPSSFTFAFRRAVGISPSQFRQRQTRGLQRCAVVGLISIFRPGMAV